jgi:hypothetical protein
VLVQVEVLTSQVNVLEQENKRIPVLHEKLDRSKAENNECEIKLHSTIEENKAIQEQVLVHGVCSCWECLLHCRKCMRVAHVIKN